MSNVVFPSAPTEGEVFPATPHKSFTRQDGAWTGTIKAYDTGTSGGTSGGTTGGTGGTGGSSGTSSACCLKTGDVVVSVRSPEAMLLDGFVPTDGVYTKTDHLPLSQALGSIPNGLSHPEIMTFTTLEGPVDVMASGNGLLIAVGDYGVFYRSQDDGVTWEKLTVEGDVNQASGEKFIAFGGGVFVLTISFPDGYHRVLTSVDGLVWDVQLPDQSFVAIQGIAYGNGRFVITSLGYDPQNYPYAHPCTYESSDNGVTWQRYRLVAPLDINGTPQETGSLPIAFAQGTFIMALVSNGPYPFSKWLKSTTVQGEWVEQSAGSNNGFGRGDLFVGLSTIGVASFVVFSKDAGLTWKTSVALPTGEQWESVVTGDGYIAISGSYNTLLSYDDGKSWYFYPLPSNFGEAWEHKQNIFNGKLFIMANKNPSPAIARMPLLTYNPNTEFYVPTSGISLNGGFKEYMKSN